MAASTLLSGGILNNGTLGGYISNATRLALGMGLAELQDGQVHFFSKHHDLLKRAVIQVASQTAYGLLRSYPRYLKYWEQRVRDKYLETKSQSSLANKTGQYYQLIKEQQAVAQKKELYGYNRRPYSGRLPGTLHLEGRQVLRQQGMQGGTQHEIWAGDIRGPRSAGSGGKP